MGNANMRPITYEDLLALVPRMRHIEIKGHTLIKPAPRPAKRLSPLQRLVAWVTGVFR